MEYFCIFIPHTTNSLVMKYLISFVLLTSISAVCACQVKQLVYFKDDGVYWKRDLVAQTEDSAFYLIPEKRKKTQGINKDSIFKTQTRKVRFINDKYDNYLSGGDRTLEYEKIAHNDSYDIHISGRQINGETVIMFKLRFIHSDQDKSRLAFRNGVPIEITTSGGEVLLIPIKGAYLLEGNVVIYNLGYISPDNAQIKKLMSGPISRIRINLQEAKLNDEYCIMRHLFALLEEKGFY